MSTALNEIVRACATDHRRGRRMAAAERLVAVIDALQKVILLEQDPARREQLVAIAETITAAQQRSDVIAIADTLEYELAPLLG